MMKALAALATYKYACFGIDVNGSHGGIQICKTDYTENELKDIVQTYIVGIVSRGSLGDRCSIAPHNQLHFLFL